ncbi:MAG TPA: hypothetical protein VK427_22670, partial [Kofleriaceae bacterium]|nr:hypothetical protein [Kofleriaceae bacterium]
MNPEEWRRIRQTAKQFARPPDATGRAAPGVGVAAQLPCAHALHERPDARPHGLAVIALAVRVLIDVRAERRVDGGAVP